MNAFRRELLRQTMFAGIAALLIQGCGEMRTEWSVRPDFLGPGSYRIEGLCSIQKDIYVTGTFEAAGGRTTCFTACFRDGGVLDWYRIIEPSGSGRTRNLALTAVPSQDETLARRVDAYVLTQADGADDVARTELILTRYDGDGNLHWQQGLLEHQGALTAALLTDAEGGIYVGGCRRDETDRPTLFIARYDDSGRRMWFTQYYNDLVDYDDLRFDVQAGPSAGIVAAGVLKPSAEVFLVRCDEHGLIRPIARYATGASACEIAGVVAGTDGAVHILATVFDDAGGSDFLTLACGADDGLLWAERYDGAAHRDDHGRAIAVDDSSNVYVTGRSENARSTAQVMTVKYDRDGNVLWSAALEDEEPVEMCFMAPARVYLGRDLKPHLCIAAARGNRATLIECHTNGYYAAQADFSRPGMVCRPMALSGTCIAVECVAANVVEARLVKFGPSKILGIARWD